MASTVFLADVFHVVKPGAKDAEGLSRGAASAAEGTEALLAVTEAGGTDCQKAEDEKHIQHQCRRQDNGIEGQVVLPPREQDLVIFEDGPDGREEQHQGQHGEGVRDVFVGAGEAFDFFTDDHGDDLPRTWT